MKPIGENRSVFIVKIPTESGTLAVIELLGRDLRMQIKTGAKKSKEISKREEKNRRLAYEAAKEGIVLLKNNGTLPIEPGPLAIFGAGASHTIKGGTGSGEVKERHSVTILEGLEKAGVKVMTKAWIEDFEDHMEDAEKHWKRQVLGKILRMDRDGAMGATLEIPSGRTPTELDLAESQTEICLYVISRISGEGADRSPKDDSYHLSFEEINNLRRCVKHYEKVILVLNTAGVMDLAVMDELPELSAVVLMGQLGMEGGTALADILFGNISPSGKLSDTWPRRYEDIPFGETFGEMGGSEEEEEYKEGIYIGYRYFDTFQIEPRFPFGYGLSYTDFSMEMARGRLEGSKVILEVMVKNTGEQYSGKEVVQIYGSCPKGRLEKEEKRLLIFGKTKELEPGMEQGLRLEFDLRDLASYDTDRGNFLLEDGDYVVRMGNSSKSHKPVLILHTRETLVVSKHENIASPGRIISTLSQQKDFRKESAPAEEEEKKQIKQEDLEGLEKIHISSDAFETADYRKPKEWLKETGEKEPREEKYSSRRSTDLLDVENFIEQCSDEELIDIMVGGGMFPKTPYFTVPGSVGNTTSKFWDKGLSNGVLCDGPAGLRLQKTSVMVDKNKVKPVEMPMEFMKALPGFIRRRMTAKPEDGVPLHQFATAFPVATSLAQTWNQDLLYRVGRAVGEEMFEYGVTYWLAPAINLHRNPLCGRNFEYFSEDPILTGKMATAIILGVQHNHGNYATVKHFACNNQEFNRQRVSANVDERPLRELYLKAFEMTVKEGNVAAVMTSYNKINGIYVTNRADLLKTLLCEEWGFDGVVMTDWYSTGKKFASTRGAAKAGNHLFMPGTRDDRRDLKRGFDEGELQREDLGNCARPILKQLMESNSQRRAFNRLMIRPFEGEEDFEEMLKIESGICARRGQKKWQFHPGGLIYDRLLFGNGASDINEYGNLILEGDQPVGYLLAYRKEKEFLLRILPEYRYRANEVVRQIKEMFDYQKGIYTILSSGEEVVSEILKAEGFEEKGPVRYLGILSIDEVVEEPQKLEEPEEASPVDEEPDHQLSMEEMPPKVQPLAEGVHQAVGDREEVEWIITELQPEDLAQRLKASSLPVEGEMSPRLFHQYIKSPYREIAKEYVLKNRETGELIAYSTWWIDGESGTALLEPIACREAYQGQGYAKKLLEENLKDLQSKNIKTAYVSTSADHRRAIILFEKCGFTMKHWGRWYRLP